MALNPLRSEGEAFRVLLYVVAVFLVAMVVVRSFRGHFTPEEHRGVNVPGIYWHFVDVMWIVVYFTIYIL